MKYLLKSNLLVLASSTIFPLVYLLICFSELNRNCVLFLMIVIGEAFIFKVAFDFSNYEHDYKYYVHRLPKSFFYICSILLNIFVIVSMVLLSSNLKWLIIISLVVVNCYHILFKKSYYTLNVLSVVCFVPILMLGYDKMFFVVLGAMLLYFIVLAYYLRHKQTTVYTYDNY